LKLLDYLKIAAAAGDIESCFELGRHYLQGVAVERDIFEAARLLTLASKQGNIHASSLLAALHLTGKT
jgi:TPR repeat protein